MSKAALFYFSGSGNTFRVAKKVKDVLNFRGIECGMERMEDIDEVHLDELEYVGILFPVAMQSTFPIVWDFVDRMPKVDGQKIFMIDTMDKFSGGVVGPLKKILTDKGYDCIAALELKMANSVRTKDGNEEELRVKNKKALLEAETFIEDVLMGGRHWGRVPAASDFMRSISKGRKIWTKTSQMIHINHEACVGCRICVVNCPVKALEMVDKKVEMDHTKCICCTRCAHNCPKEAYLWKGKKLKTLKGSL